MTEPASVARSEVVDLAPRVWRDAFPWLAIKTLPDMGSWPETAIDETDQSQRRIVFDSIVAVAIDQLGQWTIGEILPGVPLDIPIEDLRLPVRAYNVLHREKRLTTGELVDLRVDELLAYRNAGIGTVASILRTLADRSTSLPQAALVDDTGAVAEPAPPASWISALINDIETLAEWNQTTGQVDRGLLAPHALGAPGEVIAAHRRIHSLSATEVLPMSPTSAADLLEQAILGMDERYRTILARRLFSWSPVTLEQLGKEFDVSRERIRQLESRARTKLHELVAEGTAVGHIAALVRSEVRGVRPLAEVLAVVPALERTIESVGQPAWRVIDVLDDTYEIADGWCVEPSLEAAKRETAIYLDELADEFGVVRLEDVGLVGADDPGTLPWLTDWLTYLGYEQRAGYVLLRTSSINDLAAAHLSIEGGPLPIQVIIERVGRGSLGNLRNQLNVDPRFHKVDVEHWALAVWGMEKYSNIRAEIGKLLDQAGGELSLATVIDSLVERFGVASASVNVYAGSAPYEVRNGMVRVQSVGIVGGKNPAKVQGYYRRGDEWLYRTTVTHDHLRGSGWGSSTAVATILGLSPGTQAELPSRLGPQKFSWRNHQPAYGSIRRFLEADDLGIGDEIFLVFRADASFDVEKLPDLPKTSLARALRLVGADLTLENQEATDAMAAAIKYPSGLGRTTVADGYKARREPQLADLLAEADTR
ncbi:sigma factor-like helix-turn-helix DNA-binding protein [Kribbella sp. NPDC051770]|uniref:sigma factor-like helix-turn-helix DNA-binding protein n=1 Tax=Kribbella sp. NPDC051770 TaxID=3155413 RepID=UPI0034322A2A